MREKGCFLLLSRVDFGRQDMVAEIRKYATWLLLIWARLGMRDCRRAGVARRGLRRGFVWSSVRQLFRLRVA